MYLNHQFTQDFVTANKYIQYNELLLHKGLINTRFLKSLCKILLDTSVTMITVFVTFVLAYLFRVTFFKQSRRKIWKQGPLVDNRSDSDSFPVLYHYIHLLLDRRVKIG